MMALKFGRPVWEKKTDQQLIDEARSPLERLFWQVASSEGRGMTMLQAEANWKPEDLDRCEHGRHSIDACFGCPGGQSTGNLFLENGQRIGTNLSGEPIYVDTNRPPRSSG